MKETISKETFDHLVELAALAMDEDQAVYLRQELNHQLNAIAELEAIPLDNDLEITSHGVPYTAASRPEMREDEWIASERPEEILQQAPQTDFGFIVVPDIPHKKLD